MIASDTPKTVLFPIDSAERPICPEWLMPGAWVVVRPCSSNLPCMVQLVIAVDYPFLVWVEAYPGACHANRVVRLATSDEIRSGKVD